MSNPETKEQEEKLENLPEFKIWKLETRHMVIFSTNLVMMAKYKKNILKVNLMIFIIYQYSQLTLKSMSIIKQYTKY